MSEVLKDFCYECMDFEAEYFLTKRTRPITIRGVIHEIELTTAICKKCRSEEMSPLGLLDLNLDEIHAYCDTNGIPYNKG